MPNGLVDARVPGAADDRGGGECGGTLQHQAAADAADRRATAAATEQRRQGRRHGYGGERPDRRPLRALPAGEAGAFLALAQVRTQRTLLGASQTAVELPGDRQLGLATGQRRFQLLPQRSPRAEDEGLYRARLQLED